MLIPFVASPLHAVGAGMTSTTSTARTSVVALVKGALVIATTTVESLG